MARTAHEKTIAAIKRARTKRLATLATKSYYLHKRKQDEKLYTLICEEFIGLGGVYIKFLQGVLLRSKIMRKWQGKDKLKIFENLDSEPIDITALLQAELPKNRLSQIALIQPQPFAAGSFGQVYYGQLQNGQAIVVKVLRPMVRELLKYDIKLLTRFSKTFFSKLNKNAGIKLTAAMKDFTEATLRETDYRNEAQFAHELYEYYKDHSSLVIPKTYLELCTDNIIVQDYIDGISVAQIIRLQEQGAKPVDYVRETLGSDLATQLQVLGYESIVGIFDLPRIQGDPHPGNVRLMRDNKVGLIDFGISASAPKSKNNLYALMSAIDQIFKGSDAKNLLVQGMKFFVGDLYKALMRLGEFIGQKNDHNYIDDVAQVAGKFLIGEDGTSNFEKDLKNDAGVLGSMTKIVNKGNRFGLAMNLEATEVLRAIQTYTSMLGSLGMYRKVMAPMMDQAVAQIGRIHPELLVESKETVSVGQAIETVSRWLERVAERDPLLFRQLSEKMNIGETPLLKPEGEKPA